MIKYMDESSGVSNDMTNYSKGYNYSNVQELVEEIKKWTIGDTEDSACTYAKDHAKDIRNAMTGLDTTGDMPQKLQELFERDADKFKESLTDLITEFEKQLTYTSQDFTNEDKNWADQVEQVSGNLNITEF